MHDGARSEREREALFRKTTFCLTLHKKKKIQMIKDRVTFLTHVPNREKSLLMWRGISYIPLYAINSVVSGQLSRSANFKIYIITGLTVGAASLGRSQEICGFQSVVYTKLGFFFF